MGNARERNHAPLPNIFLRRWTDASASSCLGIFRSRRVIRNAVKTLRPPRLRQLHLPLRRPPRLRQLHLPLRRPLPRRPPLLRRPLLPRRTVNISGIPHTTVIPPRGEPHRLEASNVWNAPQWIGSIQESIALPLGLPAEIPANWSENVNCPPRLPPLRDSPLRCAARVQPPRLRLQVSVMNAQIRTEWKKSASVTPRKPASPQMQIRAHGHLR